MASMAKRTMTCVFVRFVLCIDRWVQDQTQTVTDTDTHTHTDTHTDTHTGTYKLVNEVGERPRPPGVPRVELPPLPPHPAAHDDGGDDGGNRHQLLGVWLWRRA